MGDDWPYHVGEFELLQRVDTSRWPQRGKLTEEELLDPDYRVDPTTVHEGYWWAIHSEEFQPLVVRIGTDAVVYRLDGEDSLNDFEFLMPIDTSSWLKGTGPRLEKPV
ncbi:hypothetical protein [Mesorhizobium sangaii]|uniref:Uncharacterized protein n=1 Tax=Mesorhizobium sangaii TaxID=505389 RepID=A0A841PGL5_9HYPH|nr:hypothetical protein [Mesorhizobium sangaii]MBB6407755.1 hypothetical protein [Mesorhizobium sangaii]